MKTAVKKTKGAAQAALMQPRNPDKTFWDACNVPDEMADEWFHTTAEQWAANSGQTISSSRGVLSRWLHFFSLFDGTSAIVKRRYGRYMQEV